MTGQTNTGGGSIGAQRKGTIVVTYPSGSTCTVSNGSQTYTALDTSGAAAFIVEPGTWTVKAVQGSESDSQSVTVAAGGWVEVELEFRLYLFNAGDPCSSVTGGWQFYSDSLGGKSAITDNMLVVDSNGNTMCTNTNSALDLSPYSKCYIRFTYVRERTDDADFIAMGFNKTKPTNQFGEPTVATYSTKTAVSDSTISIDISSVNESVYAVCKAMYHGKLSVYEMWLEK